jgi:hypothetical protein
VIVRGIEEGKNLNQISADLRQLQAEEREVARTAREAERAHADFTGKMQALQGALGALGLSVGIQEMARFAEASRDVARAETDALNQLKTAATGIDDYQKALQLGREATMGMASDQAIASSQAVLFGAGLATNSEEAAQLASAGTILTGVFESAGASQELFVRLLSSGSIQLMNNFGITTQMVQAKQKEIEAEGKLQGAEAKTQALKEVLIAQSIKYKGALSEETIAAQQNEAAKANFMASFGNLVNELDRATGATNTLTDAFVQMSAGAKSWSFVINEAIPALNDYANRSFETGQAVGKFGALADIATNSTGELTNAQRALQDSIDASAVETLATSTEEAAQAAEQEAAALANATSSIDAMGFSAKGAAEAHNPLIRGMIAASQAARDEAAAMKELAASRDVDRQAQIANSQANQNLLSAKEAAPELGAKITANRQAVFQIKEEERIANEKAAKDQERLATQSAKVTAKAFKDATKDLGSDISSAVSDAVSQNNSDVIGKLLGIEGGDANAGEAVRRMAAVAAGGIKNEWAPQLAQQLTGVQDETAKAFVQAFQQGDEGKLKGAAQQLALNPIVELFDAQAIANGVEQKLRAQQLQQQLNDKVNAILGNKGLPAVEAVTNDIGNAVTTTGQAAGQVSTDLGTLGTSAETEMAKVSTAFDGTLISIDTIILRIGDLIKMLERVKVVAGEAAGGIAGLNPPAANGAPTQAQYKMGGTTKIQ